MLSISLLEFWFDYLIFFRNSSQLMCSELQAEANFLGTDAA
jgi:hypothetical protein